MAITCNGTNQYVTMGNPAALSLTGALTATAWINTTAANSPTIVGKLYSNAYNDQGGWQLWFQTAGAWRVMSGATSLLVNGTINVRDGTPHFLAGTFTPGTSAVATLYVDGIPDGTPATGNLPAIGTTSNPFDIARVLFRGVYAYMSGSIWGVRVYNRVLSAEEILTLYRAGGADSIAYGLQGWWPLRGPGGTPATGSTPDLSTGASPGTIYNNPSYLAVPERLF